MVTENIRDMNNWTYFLGGWKCINCGHVQNHSGGKTKKCDNCGKHL